MQPNCRRFCHGVDGSKTSRRGSTCLTAGLLLLASVALASTPDQVGSWGPVLDWGVQGKHLVLLPTGKVLVWPTGANARVWDPATGVFTPVPAIFGDLHCAGQATLADGRVIVIGGVNGPPHVGIQLTSLFDPFTNTWMTGTPMNYARWYPTCTELADGRILATSGDDASGTRITYPEVYDPIQNTWTVLTGASRSEGLYPFIFQLPNGKAYEAGTGTGTAYLDVTGNGSWSSGPTNGFGSSGYSESAALYGIGKIIRCGGGDPAIARAAVIDMTAPTPAWREITSMSLARRRHNMPILADGTVLAVGGTLSADNAAQAILVPEIWNPATEQWRQVAAMGEARMYHSAALLLPDGRVLTAGGEASGRLHAQIYSPPYLYQGARPTIAASPATAAYGSTFTVTSPEAASIVSVAVLHPCTVTHAFDHNQRYVPLSFTRSGNNLLVTAPASGNNAPPGYYMLVIKNVAGLPSVAVWIRLDSGAGLTPGALTGRITDGNTGLGIGGATVAFSGGSTTTSSNGDYTLPDVPGGEHLFNASAPGYGTVYKTQVVIAGATATLDFALTQPGTVTGRVTDATTGTGIGGATLTHGGGTATTNTSGYYSISGLASGPLDLSASSFGYLSVEQTVQVPPGGTVTADFALTRVETYITGEVRDNATLQVLVGATVSYSGGTTQTSSLGTYKLDNVPPGTYTVTASMAGYASASHEVVVSAGAYGTSDFALDPAVGAVSFTVIADAQIKSSSPTSNYGSLTSLRVRALDPEYRTYLKFQVSGLGTVPSSTKLRLFVTDASDFAGKVFVVGNTWTETGLTWSNAPTIGATPAGTGGPAQLGTWVEIGLGNAVQGNGTYSFAITSTSTNSVYYSSREGANPPVLVVASASNTPSPPTISSFTPSSGTSGSSVTILGTNLSGVSSVEFNGVASPSIMVHSATEVMAVVPGGATTGRIRVVSQQGVGTSSSDFTVTNAITPLSFTPAADAQVKSANPTSNYGTLTTLRARAPDPEYRFYLKFQVSGLSTVPSSSKLRLYVTDASNFAGTIFLVGNAWTETGLTWSNAPAIGTTPVGGGSTASLGTWVEMNIGNVVQANGAYSFAITTTSTNSVYYSSREGTHAPVLVVTPGSNGPAPPTMSSFTPASESEALHAPALQFAFAPAFPNPFGASTAFGYSLPNSGPVRLRIYSVKGQLVRRLVDGIEPAGRGRIMWDGRNDAGMRLDSSIYFYQFEFGTRRQTGKLIMQR